MKIKVPSTREETVSAVYMVLPINYGEEEIPNDFPFRIGDTWAVTIDIDSGQIKDWPDGREADIHLTVKDGGSYNLINPDGKNVGAINDDYVPHGVIPGSYGDTVELKISRSGQITNWPDTPDLTAFFRE